jgi:hypothetical protein
MIEFLLHLVTGTGDWLAASVVAPVMTLLLDHPWLSGLVLLAVLAVIVGHTMQTEAAGDEDAATEAQWAGRR